MTFQGGNSTGLSYEILSSITGSARMNSYFEEAAEDKALTVELYVWNMKICQSLLFLTGLAEVALRNHMSNALQKSFLTHEEDYWYDSHVLNIFMNPTIVKAKRNCKKKRGAVFLDGLIAELPFGFWIQFFTREFRQILWIPYFHKDFGFNSQDSRASFDEFLDWIKVSVKLRNRAAHHDSFLKVDLMNEVEKLFYLVNSINSAVARWMIDESGFVDLVSRRPIYLKKSGNKSTIS